MVLTGALRGAGDTRWPLVFTLIGFFGVRFPVAWLLAIAWGWGVQGAWYAIVADLTVRAALFSARFAHGGWQRVKV
jgi:Na+-driven multidrug efflux pump